MSEKSRPLPPARTSVRELLAQAEAVGHDAFGIVSDPELQAMLDSLDKRMKKYTILDAQGNHYLTRYVVLANPDTSKIYLHIIHRSDDDRDFHDHPFDFDSHIISGSYIEHTPNGPPQQFKAGDWNRKKATALHRLEVVEGPVVTMVYRGPKVREWGFQTPPGEWTHHDPYLTAKFGDRSWDVEFE